MSLDDQSAQQPTWYNDIQTVKKMMMDTTTGLPSCPSCHMPFDKGKRRRLIDNCGHELCYSCIYTSEHCPLCLMDAPVKLVSPTAQDVHNNHLTSRPRLKTNGHFTPYMKARVDRTTSDSLQCKYDDIPARLPSANEDPSRNDLYMRLGLLLGDTAQSTRNSTSPRPGSANQSSHSQESFASVSSLASSEANTSNTSPLSTLTGSSDVEPLAPLGGLRCTNREHSSDSVASLMSTSTSTGHSSSASPIASTFHRNLPTRTSDTFLQFAKRGTAFRRSNRSTGTIGLDATVRNHNYRSTSQTDLKCLYFEVPHNEQEPLFLGRQWLFKEIEQKLTSTDSESNRGVIIEGGPGSGKSATILQLVDHSSFGRKKTDAVYEDINSITSADTYSTGCSLYQSVISLNQEAARSLGSRLVAYHFCQADNNVTCLVPEFVHNMASQLCQAPQLAAYRELVVREPRYQELLNMRSCVSDSATAFVKGILEPLQSLRMFNKIPNTPCLMIIDALNEAEFHRPDYGETIASFLAKHINKFPSWLKVVITIRTSFMEIVKSLKFHRISLDRMSGNENLQKDISSYIIYRINNSSTIRANITVNNNKLEGTSHNRFANHLASLSKGCMLYVKLTLDLIEKGHLVVKSSSYRVLPVSLSEVYLLSFNLKFTTIKSFERVSSILQVCLATLSPLTLPDIYHSVNANCIKQPVSWNEFLQRVDVLMSSKLLVARQDKTVMLAHPSLREWLVRREENESAKFLCDARMGHAMIAFRLSRFETPLDADKLLELGHHILKAHIYKVVGRDLPSHCTARDLQALWVHQSAENITIALDAFRNLYNPNVKVSRLLLLAGANPDYRTSYLDNAPLLCFAAHEGYIEMVTSLLEFGADVNASTDAGMSSLSLASRRGHLEIVRQMVTWGAKINQTDNNGQCPLVHASLNGYLDIVSYLIQYDWPPDNKDDPGLARAAQQSLVAASRRGHVAVCEFLLDMAEVDVNSTDDLTGQTPLTAACSAGHSNICEVLIQRGATLSALNRQREPPLVCAVVDGDWKVAKLLLTHEGSIELSDGQGRTPLMFAAMKGHMGVLELLLSKGASTNSTDKDGLTALCWACKKGQYQAAQCLLDHGSNIDHTDKTGQTPLDLAASHGDADTVQLLLDKGALVEHVDLQGVRPLDRAIAHGNMASVACFLHKGAKLGSQTWTLAEGKPDILLLLLNKLREDGALFYKKNRLKEATHRFQYALKKFPSEKSVGSDLPHFQLLKFQLLIGLSRCKKKLKDYTTAIDAADQAIQLKPKSWEGYYVRARATSDSGRPEEALQDIEEALDMVPTNVEIRKILYRLKDDILTGYESCNLDNDVSCSTDSAKSSSTSSCLSSMRTQTGSTETIDQFCALSLDPLVASNITRLSEKVGADGLTFETVI